jgi:23S rRNA pseudouridine1911/1915/1917 synthase
VHFQHLRHPLIGDETYRRGTRHGISFPRQALHAVELSLTHPGTRQQMTWSAPVPRDMKRLIEDLRK